MRGRAVPRHRRPGFGRPTSATASECLLRVLRHAMICSTTSTGSWSRGSDMVKAGERDGQRVPANDAAARLQGSSKIGAAR